MPRAPRKSSARQPTRQPELLRNKQINMTSGGSCERPAVFVAKWCAKFFTSAVPLRGLNTPCAGNTRSDHHGGNSGFYHHQEYARPCPPLRSQRLAGVIQSRSKFGFLKEAQDA